MKRTRKNLAIIMLAVAGFIALAILVYDDEPDFVDSWAAHGSRVNFEDWTASYRDRPGESRAFSISIDGAFPATGGEFRIICLPDEGKYAAEVVTNILARPSQSFLPSSTDRALRLFPVLVRFGRNSLEYSSDEWTDESWRSNSVGTSIQLLSIDAVRALVDFMEMNARNDILFDIVTYFRSDVHGFLGELGSTTYRFKTDGLIDSIRWLKSRCGL